MKHEERVRVFVNAIWQWYSRHKRSLPWRDLDIADPTARAYRILVSEIMLQQTQVPRVIITYRNFLERFPAINSLAEASNKEVLIAWRGMGYNSRALRLRDAVRAIMENAGRFPSSMEHLTALPGIGHYTAAAIRNFAFGIPTPCIDTNIRRILHRTFVGPESQDGSWSKDDSYLLKIAGEVLEEAIRQKGKKGREGEEEKNRSSYSSLPSSSSLPSEWHAALMDFGSLVQTKRNPKWDVCVLTKKGIMKTTPKSSIANRQGSVKVLKKEPGRMVGATFVPNRIFRGRVIEALRDAPQGLTLHDIGREIAVDWDPGEHHEWLQGILQQLTRETMLGVRKGRYVLG